MEKVTILDKTGNVIWYAEVTKEGISLEYESYDKAEGVWLESAYRIPLTEFEKIKELFKITLEIPMSLILKLISEEGLGDHFRDLVIDGRIESEKFFWYS